MENEEKARATRTHCASGHELTDDNVRILNKGSGRKYKQCLTCKPGQKGSMSRSANSSSEYQRPTGSRMRSAMSKGVFGDGMTRADIMKSRS